MKQLKVFICIVIMLYIGIYPVLATNFGNPLFQSDAMGQVIEKFRNWKNWNGLLPVCSISWYFVLAILVIVAVFLGYWGGGSIGCLMDPIMLILAFLPACISYFVLGILGLAVVWSVTYVAFVIGAFVSYGYEVGH